MRTNWQRGIIRSYVVLWALWVLFLLVRIASLPPILWRLQLTALIVWGLAIPGLLFLGVRWAANGFLPSHKSSGSE